MNKILSIDPSLTATGYAIFNTDNEIVAYGEITTNKKNNIETRLFIIYSNLKSVINTYNPSIIIIEKMFVNMNGKTSMNIAAVRGIVLLLCGEYSISSQEIMATSVRRVLLGKGNASKLEVRAYIENNIPSLESKISHNIIDAIAIGLYYLKNSSIDISI